MAALVQNGVYKNPYFSKNIESISKKSFLTSWWYRTEFQLSLDKTSENIRIIFEGINYSADIWLNGLKIASRDTIFGAFRMFDLDITNDLRDGKNVLALEVFPPKPGDPTIGFVDWNPRSPDENMGIWRPVKLKRSRAVSVNHPFVMSRVNLETLDEADLTIHAELRNHSPQSIDGLLHMEIDQIHIAHPFHLEDHETRKISLTSEAYPELSVQNPRLWWPNHLGEPNLYALKLNATVDNHISDEQTIQFGIRDVSDYINEDGYRGYRVNGKNVLIRGAGWVDDLTLADDERRVKAQMEYVKHMNLNAIRLEGFWGNRQLLYDLADEKGILIMPGWSCQWEWEGYLGGPVDHYGGIITQEDMDLVATSLNDQILWLRNHPSIFVWVLGSDMLPRPALEKKYISNLAQIDPTRPSLHACSNQTSQISGSTGVKMTGPYEYVTPNYWYVDKSRGGAFGFNTETGPGPQLPPLESI